LHVCLRMYDAYCLHLCSRLVQISALRSPYRISRGKSLWSWWRKPWSRRPLQTVQKRQNQPRTTAAEDGRLWSELVIALTDLCWTVSQIFADNCDLTLPTTHRSDVYCYVNYVF